MTQIKVSGCLFWGGGVWGRRGDGTVSMYSPFGALGGIFSGLLGRIVFEIGDAVAVEIECGGGV